ncbi:HAD family phosphatase [Bacteroidales bacterium OttesenSCG-928-M11]|nr:HAD family phosphatase [Bacteroidales bacterium OttesenSCG-928-M11]
MEQNIAFFFDLDGVIIDTEPQYDLFWRTIAQKYNLLIRDFEKVIKGNTLPNIMTKYFYSFPIEVQEEIEADNKAFDLRMDIVPIPGVIDFLEELKKADIPAGLVTSSSDRKLDYVFSQLPLEQYFQSVVSGERVREGKPNPMCYLLSAEDLCVDPQCGVVFEDSLNGINSGNAAGMKVIGLSTTHPKEMIEPYCSSVIPNFESINLDTILKSIR